MRNPNYNKKTKLPNQLPEMGEMRAIIIFRNTV